MLCCVCVLLWLCVTVYLYYHNQIKFFCLFCVQNYHVNEVLVSTFMLIFMLEHHHFMYNMHMTMPAVTLAGPSYTRNAFHFIDFFPLPFTFMPLSLPAQINNGLSSLSIRNSGLSLIIFSLIFCVCTRHQTLLLIVYIHCII